MVKEVISSIVEVYGRMTVTRGDVHEYVRGGGGGGGGFQIFEKRESS